MRNLIGSPCKIGGSHGKQFGVSNFPLVARAFAEFAELLKKADECRMLFEQAGQPLPEPLQLLLGLNATVDAGHQLPPMKLPSQPAGRQASWIWIPTEQCTVSSLASAVLRANGRCTVQKIADDVQRLKGSAVNPGSVANVLTRLSGATKADRTDDGWALLGHADVPVLHEGHLWGDLDVFEKQEVAAHRRMAILHVLGQFSGGLQIVQIVEMLRDQCPWFSRDIPCNKDLVKVDMEELDELGKVKRQGNSKKWVLA